VSVHACVRARTTMLIIIVYRTWLATVAGRVETGESHRLLWIGDRMRFAYGQNTQPNYKCSARQGLRELKIESFQPIAWNADCMVRPAPLSG